MSRIRGILLAALCVAGCGPSVQYASTTVQAEALTFVPAAGKSRIYVYRTGGFVGSAVSLAVAVDSQVVGATDPNSFLMVEVDPGAHLVSSPTAENEAFVKLDALPDSCYFVKMWSKMGIMAAHSGMERMQPDSARRAIRKAQMAVSSWPGVPIPKAQPDTANPSPIAQ
jgi:hypothetical protein